MDQESNNMNQNDFNMPTNNVVPNNEQTINQMNTPQPTSQPVNTFETTNTFENSNGKPPKKINIGLILGIVAVLVIIVVVSILLLSKNENSNNSNNTNNTNNVDDNYNNGVNDNNLGSQKYEGEKIKLFDDTDYDEVNGKIKDVSLDFKYLITNDNSVYRLSSRVEKKLKLEKDAKLILDNRVDSQTTNLLVQNKDGSISHISPGDSKINYTINLQKDIVYADTYNIITLEDGYLYHYKIDNNKATKKGKVTLFKDRNEKETYSQNSKVTLDYLPADSSFFLRMEDGDIRQFETWIYSTYGYSSPTDSTISPAIGEREYLENKKATRMLYYDIVINEIYAAKDKNTSIYYYEYLAFDTVGDEIDCIKEKGSEALCYDSIRKELALPEGYTTDDIKEIRSTSHHEDDVFNLLIIMNDMKVFYYYDGWKELEELSNLYKNNHVVKLITDQSYSSDITILCDDGYLYEYQTY